MKDQSVTLPRAEDQSAERAGSTVRAGVFDVGYIDDGDGVPLVLIHGGESDRHQFTVLRRHLGAGLRVISYDQRDSGLTTNPPAPYGLADLADDLVALLDALKLSTAHVLGTSFGGAIAQHVALRHPARISSLILVATTPSYALGSPIVDALLSMSHQDRQNAATELFFTPKGRSQLYTPPGQTLTKRTAEQSRRRRNAARQHDIRDRLPSIAARTLILHGTEDQLAPWAGALLMAEQIPNAELQSIDGGRHAIAIEFANTVAARVREFLPLLKP